MTSCSKDLDSLTAGSYPSQSHRLFIKENRESFQRLFFYAKREPLKIKILIYISFLESGVLDFHDKLQCHILPRQTAETWHPTLVSLSRTARFSFYSQNHFLEVDIDWRNNGTILGFELVILAICLMNTTNAITFSTWNQTAGPINGFSMSGSMFVILAHCTYVAVTAVQT